VCSTGTDGSFQNVGGVMGLYLVFFIPSRLMLVNISWYTGAILSVFQCVASACHLVESCVSFARRSAGVPVSVTFGGVAVLVGTFIVIGNCLLRILEWMYHL
jgi:hypothetical protein